MYETTADHSQQDPTVSIERFAVYGLDSCNSLHFESTSDLAMHLRNTVSDTSIIDIDEEQILVRYNVDDEGMAVVYVDSAAGPKGDDLGAIDAAIRVLTDARGRLATLQGAGR